MVQGLDQVESLKNAVRGLQTATTPAAADLTKLKNAAMALGSATGRTESDLRRSINALKDVRAQLSITGAEYRKLTGTIDQYQRQLDKATGAQQRGGRAAQFGQTVGAVAASGVFGGPEGLLGAGIGAAFGGPAGALAGGAIGAQVGMLRQQLGGTATLAADLEKQRIALRLILKDTAEYNSALEFLAKTSKDYAIPQDRLIKGFTQVAASVVGAGGNIADTKTAFEGVTAGIRGTGRSLEDLDGALLATAQVFSKGKVSAEELRGQIGERLPGAFTLFAEAIGKTPQELDKALERGEVSLQDFLTFAKSVFGEYGENAKIIAESPAAAGDRLQTSLKNLSESVGRLLQPIGASFQNTFADIASYIDGAAKRLANFLGLNKTNADKIGELNNVIITQQKAIDRERAKAASGVSNRGEAAYAIQEFEGRIARAQAELKTLKALEEATQKQGEATRSGLQGQTPGSDSNDKKAAAAAKKAAAEAERLAAEQQRLNEATAKAQVEQARTVFNNQMELVKKRWDYEDQRLKMQRDLQAGALTGIRAEQARAANEFLAQREAIRRQIREATLGVAIAERNAGFNAQMEAVTGQGLSGGGGLSTTGIIARTGNTGDSTGAHLDLRWGDGRPITRADADKYFLVNGKAPSSFGVTSPYGPRNLFGRNFHNGIDFGTPAGSAVSLRGGATFGRDLGNTGAGGYAVEVMTPEGTMRALHLMAGSAMRTGAGAQGVAGQTLRNVAAQGKLGSANAEVQQAGAIQGLTRQQGQETLSQMGAKFVQERTQAMREEIAQMERGNTLALERAKLEQSGMRPELIEAAIKGEGLRLDYLERQAQIRADIARAEEAGDQGAIEYFNNQLAESNTHYERQLELVNALAQAQTAQGVALANYVGQLRLQLAEMTNIENVLISVGQTIETEISTAMSTAVSAVVTGSGSVKQVLAQMFQNIGQSFVQMATQIIAKQMVMIVLQSILKALGAGGFGGGGGGNAATALGSNPNVAAYAPLADGGVFGGGIQPFAKGGVVSRPTFFKFANGGAMQNGVMGEAGPEAIVPLKRGFDGKLGIAQAPAPKGGDSRMRDMMGRSPAQAPSPVLNMKFETTKIGGVEYVSREQLEVAMAQTRRQASRDGAQRGMSMTLDKIQNSPQTRSRIGVR